MLRRPKRSKIEIVAPKEEEEEDIFYSKHSHQHVSGNYCSHLHDDVLITRIQLWLTVSPSLHDNENYILSVKIIYRTQIYRLKMDNYYNCGSENCLVFADW